MPESLQTARLLLRPWSETDVGLLARLATDPIVVRYIGDGRPWPEERTSQLSGWLAEHWREHGFGWRVALEKAGGAAVGLIALNYLGEGTAGLSPSEYEIGWWLAPAAWGQRYAGEAALAVRDEAFERVGAPSVVARIQAANGRSVRVAEKLELTHEFDTTGRFGEPLGVYRGWAPPDAAARAGG